MTDDTGKSMPWPQDGYLVGGAVRDRLAGLTPKDHDWLVPDPKRAAADFAASTGGSAFCLDDERDHWRVVATGPVTHDFTPLRPVAGDLRAGLERDLFGRDLSINAMALTADEELVDPTGGSADLAQRTLRTPRTANLAADTLRLLRVARFAATLGFTIEGDTHAAVRELAAAQAAGEVALPASERVGAELNELLLSERAAAGVRLLEELGLLSLYLPELAAGRGVEQRGLHHLDVLDHSIAALAGLVDGFPDAGLALRWATLLHDVGKPPTREVDELGQVRFYGHAREGARLTARLLRRLRLPTEVVAHASGLVRYHMVNLPDSERAARRFVHRRRQLLPDLLRLMLADREAARGRRASAAGRTAYRLAISRVLAVLDEEPAPAPLLDGHTVMAILGLPPGPRVGEALAFVAEAAAVGDAKDAGEAEQLLLGYARAQGWLVDG